MCFFVCCASPRWCVASFARSSLLCWFFVPPSCPFIPFCSSVAVMTLRRSGHARTCIPFFPYVCGGEHRHSFDVTSCWFSLPVRFSLRFSWRRTLALLDPNLLVLRLLRRYAYNIWHITSFFFGGRWRCCCLCVLFMHDMQHTCAASFFFCRDLLRVLRRRPIPYASGLVLLGRVLVVCLHRGAVRYILVLSLSTSYRVVLVSLVSSVARHITYLFVGGRWRCCCLCVVCFRARTSP